MKVLGTMQPCATYHMVGLLVTKLVPSLDFSSKAGGEKHNSIKNKT